MGRLVLISATMAALAPSVVHAQSYLAPLVTPPASVGACQPTRTVLASRAGATPFTGHRLVISGTRLGERRQITVFVDARHAMLYDDMRLVMTSRLSSTSTDVLASIDALGRVHGRRQVGTSVLPDSVLTMRHDTAALRRVKEQAQSTASQVPLTSAEQGRAREMAAWLLKRCP